MTNFDLEERSLLFAKKVIDLVQLLPRNPINRIHIDQIVRSSGSIGANYIEANESLGTKDFYLRLKIARKEARETRYWLNLIKYTNPQQNEIIEPIEKEVTELIKILSAIIKKGT